MKTGVGIGTGVRVVGPFTLSHTKALLPASDRLSPNTTRLLNGSAAAVTGSRLASPSKTPGSRLRKRFFMTALPCWWCNQNRMDRQKCARSVTPRAGRGKAVGEAWSNVFRFSLTCLASCLTSHADESLPLDARGRDDLRPLLQVFGHGRRELLRRTGARLGALLRKQLARFGNLQHRVDLAID